MDLSASVVDETGFPRRMTKPGRPDADIRVRKHIYPTVSGRHFKRTKEGKIRETHPIKVDLRKFMSKYVVCQHASRKRLSVRHAFNAFG